MSGDEIRPSADTTLAVMLGVSKCPSSPHLADLPGSANSAQAFYDYLTRAFGLPELNVKYLFDSPKSPSDQLREIGEWLFNKKETLKDLIIFYTGHGGFTPGDHKFFLATRTTAELLEGGTSIRIVDLATLLKVKAWSARKYLIFDCCFAASVVAEFMSSPGSLAVAKTKEVFPSRGTAVLCSSSSQDLSIAPRGGQFTSFAEALFGVLQEGSNRVPTDLSLHDVGAQVRERIVEKYPKDRMRPEVHSPDQAEGNVASVRLFPNVALRPGRSDGLRGGYGFLTDYRSYPGAEARDRVARLVQTFGIKEFQFYDWFATYSKPTNGSSWPDPFKREREIYLETILTYIDEIHRHGGRAWACVQAVGADEADLADPSADPGVGIHPLLDRYGKRYSHPPAAPKFWTYFLNAAWADRMTGIWGLPVKNLGFDGIHWDTLGRRAGDYIAEVNGTHAFLRRAKGTLAPLGLSQTLNFVDLAWWDPDLVASGIVAFPYAEVWTMTSEQSYYVAMNNSALARMWGVMAFYPTVDKPEGWTDSKVMLARWAEAPKHRLMYLILGDHESRLVGPYFPDATPLSPSERVQMAASLPLR